MPKIPLLGKSKSSYHMVKIVFGHTEVEGEPTEANQNPVPVVTHNAEFFGKGHSYSSALDDANNNLQKFLTQTQMEVEKED